MCEDYIFNNQHSINDDQNEVSCAFRPINAEHHEVKILASKQKQIKCFYFGQRSAIPSQGFQTKQLCMQEVWKKH